MIYASGGISMHSASDPAGQGTAFPYFAPSPAGGYVLSTSDKRLKRGFTAIDDPLKKVNSLKGIYFQWSKGINGIKGGTGTQRRAGFVAQDVQRVLPEGVGEIYDGKYLGVNAEAILSLVVEALKELNAKVDLLERRFEGFLNRQGDKPAA